MEEDDEDIPAQLSAMQSSIVVPLPAASFPLSYTELESRPSPSAVSSTVPAQPQRRPSLGSS